MTERHQAPPRFARRILEWALPRDGRADAALGDLHEEFGRREAQGRRRAVWWYWREALLLAGRYRIERYLSARRNRRGRGGPGGWEKTMDVYRTNLRLAVRRLVHTPLFTLVAVASLAIGIGANTAMFSLVNAVILRDLPYEQPEELLDIYLRQDGFSHGTLSYPDYEDVVERTDDVFEGVAASQFAMIQVDVDGGVDILTSEAVSGNYFDVLGLRPALGRAFGEEDDVEPGAHPVVMLGHGYWENRYAADPGVIGSEMRLSGRPYTIVGVAPEDFRGHIRGLEPQVYVPIMMFEELQPGNETFEQRRNHSLFAKARLRDGVTMAQANGVAERVAQGLREEYPDMWLAGNTLVLEPTEDVIMNPMVDRLLVPAAGTIMVVVGLVLLIACANLASFLLARAADRRKEIAVRLALGARRRTLMGQLLTESLVLAALGGAAGVGLAVWALQALQTADLPLPLPITLDLSLDANVLLFTAGASIMAGVLFGLVPALQATTPDVAPTLRDESAGGGRGKSAMLRDLLVMGQVAVSVVLLVGAGLFLRSLDASRKIDPGFGTDPAGIIEIILPAQRYGTEEVLAYVDRLEEAVGAQRDISAVGLTTNLHLNPTSTSTAQLNVDGIDPPEDADFHQVDQARIDGPYLDAVGLTLLEGRTFDRSDGPDGEPVAIVNQAFVRRFFPSGEAIGRTVRIWDGPELTVVGVVETARIRQLSEEPRPFLYRNYRQGVSAYLSVVARTSGDPAAAGRTLFSEVRRLDPDVIVYQTKTMARHLAVMLLPRQLGALVVAAFASLALLLAAIGLYGIVSYAVAKRAREVGIRMALGAESGNVTWMLTRGGVRLVVLGGVVGLALSALVARLVSGLLYGVPALDPVTFGAVPAMLAVVALLASWIPARRVTRVDPVNALRAE